MKRISHHKLLLLSTVLFIAFTAHFKSIYAQSCTALVPPTTINGISVTSSFTGSVTSFVNPYTSCGTYTTPANSIHLGPSGPFTYTLNFSAPVNCLNFILTGTGQGGNEDFTFTTNTGTPTITDNSSCFTTINGNLILSGAGATASGGGGGGDFTIVNPQQFTTLTITGSGLYFGSLFAICQSSLISNTIIENTVSICAGDSAFIAGDYQTTAGLYSDTVYGGSICGGDSITNTLLTINPLPSPTINAIPDQCESNDSTLLSGNPTGGVFSGNGVTGTNFDPSIAGSGTHTITYLYTDSNGCSDSTTTDITVKPAPPVDIDLIDDLCENGDPVSLSGNPSGGIFSGNGVTGNNFDPSVTGAGNHAITYAYTYPNGCTATQERIIKVNEIPIPLFVGDELIGCEEHTVIFTDSTGFSSQSCTWEFGDGETSNQCDSVTHTYTNSGFFDVMLTLEDTNGCIGSTTLTNYIEVLEGPTASFSANPMSTDYNNTEVIFTNESVNASSYLWDFGDFSTQVSDLHPTHNFPTGEVGNYEVKLYAIDDKGCIDSTVLTIEIMYPDLTVDIPNVFTPNGDNENDFFKLIKVENLLHLEIIILNRWGNVVFESTDLNFNWNGKLHNVGEKCTEGTYFYKINLKDLNEKEVEEHGFVHLSRGE